MPVASDKVKDRVAKVPANAKPARKYPKKGAGKKLGWKNPNGGK